MEEHEQNTRTLMLKIGALLGYSMAGDKIRDDCAKMEGLVDIPPEHLSESFSSLLTYIRSGVNGMETIREAHEDGDADSEAAVVVLTTRILYSICLNGKPMVDDIYKECVKLGLTQ